MKKYIDLIREYSKKNYKQMTKQGCGQLKFPFVVPGSQSYVNSLWDWDSWLTDVAIRQIMKDNGNTDTAFLEYETGSVLNFLENTENDGRMPILIGADSMLPDLKQSEMKNNIHKPCIAQHIAFIIKENLCGVEWLKPYISKLHNFMNYYRDNCFHEPTGLYYWINDLAIGVDNDPCTFFRPNNSSASIYLNCLMYKELEAMAYISEMMNEVNVYTKQANELKEAINNELWDERNGFYYSADINMIPIDNDGWLHKGCIPHWHCVLQKIDMWSGFMAMWAGIADENRAKRMVYDNLLKEELFNSKFGIRSMAKTEPMYAIIKSGNPSCWLGPIWGITNYMCFRGLVKYEFIDEAKALAEKSILLFGQDIEKNGAMHEYYHPDTGEGITNIGFQNWNLLVNNMIAWIEHKEVVEEF